MCIFIYVWERQLSYKSLGVIVKNLVIFYCFKFPSSSWVFSPLIKGFRKEHSNFENRSIPNDELTPFFMDSGSKRVSVKSQSIGFGLTWTWSIVQVKDTCQLKNSVNFFPLYLSLCRTIMWTSIITFSCEISSGFSACNCTFFLISYFPFNLACLTGAQVWKRSSQINTKTK